MEMKPLCQTCTNIFDFPKCCTENLEDSVKIITNCGNYNAGCGSNISESTVRKININEQIKELRECGNDIIFVSRIRKIFTDAADTIELLSTKLQAAKYCGDCPGIDTEIPCAEECKRRHFQSKINQESIKNG